LASAIGGRQPRIVAWVLSECAQPRSRCRSQTPRYRFLLSFADAFAQISISDGDREISSRQLGFWSNTSIAFRSSATCISSCRMRSARSLSPLIRSSLIRYCGTGRNLSCDRPATTLSATDPSSDTGCRAIFRFEPPTRTFALRQLRRRRRRMPRHILPRVLHTVSRSLEPKTAQGGVYS